MKLYYPNSYHLVIQCLAFLVSISKYKLLSQNQKFLCSKSKTTRLI